MSSYHLESDLLHYFVYMHLYFILLQKKNRIGWIASNQEMRIFPHLSPGTPQNGSWRSLNEAETSPPGGMHRFAVDFVSVRSLRQHGDVWFCFSLFMSFLFLPVFAVLFSYLSVLDEWCFSKNLAPFAENNHFQPLTSRAPVG